MIKKTFIISLILITTTNFAKSQDTAYALQLIQKLAHENMYGRGYVKKGDKKAAKLLKSEFKKMGIAPLGEKYYQEFSFPMNTFPGSMEVKIDGRVLNPVSDYVVSPDFASQKGTFAIHYLPAEADTVETAFDSISKIDYTGKYLLSPFKKHNLQRQNPFKAAGIIQPKPSVYWWASTGHSEAETGVILVVDSLLTPGASEITVDIKNKFIKNHKTQNVLATVKGTQQPDSFIVFTAHYDHLGTMGKSNVFRGANDNASGTALVMALAKYFSQPENRPKYSLAFMLFAAEESGLIGSSTYVENPRFPLNNISALLNFDMVGSGSEGITLVNGKNNPEISNVLTAINAEKGYLANIKLRGEACNSDHCFFHKKGVPAVFIYTRGKEFKEYHNLNDNPEKLPLTAFYELQKLIIDFVELKN